MAERRTDSIRILQIPFGVGNVHELVEAALDLRGLVTAPSAPCLALAAKDARYTGQLAESQLVLPDSGAMVLVWRLIRPSSPLQRVSGLAFLSTMLEDPRLRQPGALFLVDPSPEASARNRCWLQGRGIPIQVEDQYVAPLYSPDCVEDPILLDRLRQRAPRYVLINLGGGIQERLGAWLQQQWQQDSADPKLPAIFCTGAAIAFLTGEQSRIPAWADRLYLGWAVRCLGRSSIYVPRYFKSFPVLYYTLRAALKK